MVIKKLLKLLPLLGLLSCGTTSKDVELEVLIKDTVNVEEKVLAKVYSNNSDWKLIKAYFDCINDSISSIDFSNETIEGCSKDLFVKNDTVLIQFTPKKTGHQHFGRIEAPPGCSIHYTLVFLTSFEVVLLFRPFAMAY